MTITQIEKEIKNYHNGKGIVFYMSRELTFARFGEN